MSQTKVLIAVKTYPSLSSKYDELVCTAGFLEDGSWIRIYPVPFRKLDFENQYRKWQWIEMNLVKNEKDFRPESFRPYDIDEDIRILDTIGTKNAWSDRRKIVLKNVRYDMGNLISDAKDPSKHTSLAVFKPKEILDFRWEPTDREWDQKKLEEVYAHQREMNLFDQTRRIFKVARKLPYKFKYVFRTEDGRQCDMMIEDWEIGMLYWKSLSRSGGDEKIACENVKKKYFDNFARTKDLYLFLGTSLKYHSVGINPFMIIGVFYPPFEEQNEPTLFDID